MQTIDPADIAGKYLSKLQQTVSEIGERISVVGLIASDDKPSVAYANATKRTFTEAGFGYELRHIERLDLENEIIRANNDPAVHGIFIYFPVFNNQEDNYLRNLVSFEKDIEAGSLYWTRKMSSNDRSATSSNDDKKALVPCTPLAIIKILNDLREYDLTGKTVTIFNRSEVIGRPLAVMMSNDSARVFSFDVNGPLEFNHGEPSETHISRKEALSQSSIVITGVPSKSFELIRSSELPTSAVAVNFSSQRNFEEGINNHVRLYVPRVGPMTVAMCMRNTIRLYENFHR